MHIKSVGAALALSLLATTAMAADLPSRRAPPVYSPPPPIPVFTWTGLYVGVHAGYEFGRSNALATNSATGAGLVANGSSPDGVIGGGHIGYLFSTQGLPLVGSSFGGLLGAGGVIGVEGDVDGSNYRSNYALGGFNTATRQNIQGSVRGRLGIAVDRVLFYATGGAAFGGLTNSYTNPFTGGYDSLSHTRVGYTVGGGVEYAITNNVSVRAEYRYTDFGSFTDNLANASLGGVNVRHRETDNRVQGGISYKFDTFSPIAPVVARY
jgi:outer membrane immunogenic protein